MWEVMGGGGTGGGGERGGGGGETLRCHRIGMGSDESRFNASLIVTGKVARQCPQTTAFESDREPKRYRTEVLLFAYQPNALAAGQIDSLSLSLSLSPLYHISHHSQNVFFRETGQYK